MQFLCDLSLFAAVIWGIVTWTMGPVFHTPPGILVAEEPVQQTCPTHDLPKVKEYNISAVATYNIKARVLHKKLYYTGGNDLVPYDIALGWGRMSDESILGKMTITQGNRFYFYEYEGSAPIPEKEIIAHSSNNHLIPANSTVASAIKGLYPGEVVTLSGYLVNVSGPNSFHWATSLSRTDTGAGACEVMYVEKIAVDDSPVPVPPAAVAGAPGA